ncbi:MAG: alpha/beta hydrolase [Chlamydiia bacterium]|nr:alpha/beta hydrolase [Chlamydiia bacterium]
MDTYTYDENNVRYQLVKETPAKALNWLFIPGGPGGDSSYLKSLVDILPLEGKVWLIDLPGNGSNENDSFGDDFDRWIDIFPEVIERFENPVIVGHSFGGMFPLMFPELEKKLKGFVILNSAPSLWMEEAVKYAGQFDLPDISESMQAFVQEPCQKTFDRALDACMPYYFPKETLDLGRSLLKPIPFRYQPAVWWQTKAVELNFSAKWVPEKVPTRIVSGKYDCITPHTLFDKDKRFKRDNIEYSHFDNAGHVPWLENPEGVKQVFIKLQETI